METQTAKHEGLAELERPEEALTAEAAEEIEGGVLYSAAASPLQLTTETISPVESGEEFVKTEVAGIGFCKYSGRML